MKIFSHDLINLIDILTSNRHLIFLYPRFFRCGVSSLHVDFRERERDNKKASKYHEFKMFSLLSRFAIKIRIDAIMDNANTSPLDYNS